MTTPTAPAAGVHLPWARVPEAVQAWAARLGGGPPAIGARPVRRLLSGRHQHPRVAGPDAFFVKAVGAELNPDSPVLHRREIRISTALPSQPTLSHGSATRYDDGDWVALAFDVVDGRPPRHPWDAGELDVVLTALSAMHDELTPSPVPALEPLADTRTQPVRRLGGVGGTPDGATGSAAVGDHAPAAPGRARVGVARRLRRLDAGPWRRAGRQRPGGGRTGSCSSTGRTVRWATRPSTSSPGPPRWSWRAARPPKNCWPVTNLPGAPIPKSSPCSCAPSPVSSSNTPCALHPPGCRPPAVPGRPGRGGPGLAAPPHRLVTTGAPPGRSR